MIAVGGITDFADGNRSNILRTSEGNKLYSVRLDDLLRNGDISANVAVKPGDVLIIPRAGSSREARIWISCSTNYSQHLRGIWLRRFWGLAVAWLVAVVGLPIALFTPSQYEASARVFVDTESVLKPLMAGLAVQPNTEQQIKILADTLMSRPNVEKLISACRSRSQCRDRAGSKCVDRKNHSGCPADGLDKGQSVLALVPGHGSSACKAHRRLAAVDVRGVRAEQQAARHGQSAGFPGCADQGLRSRTDARRRNVSRSSSCKISITLLRRRTRSGPCWLSTARSRKRAPNFGPPSNGGMPCARSSPARSQCFCRIGRTCRRIARQRRTLSRRSTPEQTPCGAIWMSCCASIPSEHPDVVGTRRILADLEKQREAMLEAAESVPDPAPSRRAAPASGAQPGRTSSSKWRLAEAEANVAALGTRLSQLESRYNRMRAAAKLKPEFEEELAQLNRDYQIQKTNFEQLVQRREQAKLTGTAGRKRRRRLQGDRSPAGLVQARGPQSSAADRGSAGPLAGSRRGGELHGESRYSRLFRQSRTCAPSRRCLFSVPSPISQRPAMLRQRKRNKYAFAGGVTGLCALFGVALTALFVAHGWAKGDHA